MFCLMKSSDNPNCLIRIFAYSGWNLPFFHLVTWIFVRHNRAFVHSPPCSYMFIHDNFLLLDTCLTTLCFRFARWKHQQKSQTVPKKAWKRWNELFKGQKSQTLFVVLLFLGHKETSKLQEYDYKFSSKLRLSLVWHCAGDH